MKVTILWVKSEVDSLNKKTKACLDKELIDFQKEVNVLTYEGEYEGRFEWYNSVLSTLQSDYVTAINSGDFWRPGALKKILKAIKKVSKSNPDVHVFSQVRLLDEKEYRRAAFSSDISINKDKIFDLDKEFIICPGYFWGNWFKVEEIRKFTFNPALTMDTEKDFFMHFMNANKKVYYLHNAYYYLNTPVEGSVAAYPPIYDLKWYYDSLENYWLPFLKEMKEEYGEIPLFIQYQAVYAITRRVSVNRDNKNKHLFKKDEVVPYLMTFKPLFDELDDRVLFNADGVRSYDDKEAMRWIYGKIKYGEDFRFEPVEDKDGVIYMGYKDVKVLPVRELLANILMTEFVDGCLEFDGNIQAALYPMAKEIYFDVDGKKFPLEYRERYSLTKAFGISIFKNAAFHVSIPLEELGHAKIKLIADFGPAYGNKKAEIDFQYESHFSKVSLAFPHSYWYFKGKKRWIGTATEHGMNFRRSNPVEHVLRELLIWIEMLCFPDVQTKKFLLLRIAYFICKPFMKGNRKVWLYMDKIYKGGDSSEYMYKYALDVESGKIALDSDIERKDGIGYAEADEETAGKENLASKENFAGKENPTGKENHAGKENAVAENHVAEKENAVGENHVTGKVNAAGKAVKRKKAAKIDHYYLVDGSSTDYKRLTKEGYKVLLRGTPKARLIFLYSDLILATNSTVCSFNNYGLPNSSYMRDIINFDCVCLQHGLSVQKIAIAQNRLRDKTKLYFCASKYEIDNLSKPVYDYQGYDALKLSGIPRYDGLVDRHVKQIMISPTWRMQAAIQVKTNEGEQRGYNPLFKESDYYKIYNSLINDERLIAAAKEYGYRIKYVLHPIVSSQVKDFDTNDYVDVIPAVGDMSYEDMFCESALMVTDFSGIQFDFGYMRKPVVYLHHEDIPQHYEEGSFFYDSMGFGEICRNNDELIDLLIEYMKNDCRMKEEFVKRADDFFAYKDRNNCQRVYEELIKHYS